MRIFVQLTLALKYIHHHKILHRDIKPQNVFLTSDGCVKLGDFGVAKTLSSSASMAHTQLGTPYYLSPEIFNDENYDSSSDMWSLGVLAFELTTLTLPFQAASLGKLAVRVLREEPPIPTCSPELQGVLGKLLTKCAQDRPSASDLLRYPFVREHAKRLLDHTAATGFGGLEEDVDVRPPSSRRPSKDDEEDIDRRDRDEEVPESCSGEDNTHEANATPTTCNRLLSASLRGDEIHGDQDTVEVEDNECLEAKKAKFKNPYARPRSRANNPYARQRGEPGLDCPQSEEEAAALCIQHSWRQASNSSLNVAPEPDAGAGYSDSTPEGTMAEPRIDGVHAESDDMQQLFDPSSSELDRGEHVQAVLTIQRSWRSLAAVHDPPRLPKRNHAGDSSPNQRSSAHSRRRPASRRPNTRQSVKNSLARAAERGAARRAQSEVKQREQRIKMLNERGEAMDDVESPREEVHNINENTVVIQLSDNKSIRPVSASASKSPDNVYGPADGSFEDPSEAVSMDDLTAVQSLGLISPSWRVRGHISAAEERGRARKALAEEKAARIQRELEDTRGFSRHVASESSPGASGHVNEVTLSPANTSLTPSRRRRRRWAGANQWVPELPTLAASNIQLAHQLAQESGAISPTPAAAGAAGRAVNAVRSARRTPRDTPNSGRRDPTRKYKTKPSSQALKSRLASMLDGDEGP